MTNYEKFKDWFDDNDPFFKLCNGEFGVEYKTNTPEFCDKISCDDCLFLDCNCDSCTKNNWLNSTYKATNTNWSKVKKDTLIDVCDSSGWVPRYFCDYIEPNVYYFLAGATSETYTGTSFVHEDLARLHTKFIEKEKEA